MKKRICCIGQGIIDYVILSLEMCNLLKYNNNELEMSDLQKLIDSLSDNIVYCDIGGAVLNTSVDMSFLGLKNYIVLSIGHKNVSFFQEKLSSIPNITPLLQIKECTGKVLTFIPRETELSLPSYANAFNYGCANDITLDGILKQAITESYLVYTSLYSFYKNSFDNNERLLQFAKKESKKVAIDAGGCKNFKDTDSILYLIKKYVDILFVNEVESTILHINENFDVLINNVEMIVQKKGIQGSLILTSRDQIHVPSPKTEIVNTLGVGDAYSAGFLLGLSKGYSIYDCGILGTKVAQIVIKSKNLRLCSPTYDV